MATQWAFRVQLLNQIPVELCLQVARVQTLNLLVLAQVLKLKPNLVKTQAQVQTLDQAKTQVLVLALVQVQALAKVMSLVMMLQLLTGNK